MKSKVLLILLFTFIFASCGEQKKNGQDALFEKVMEVHDEIMAKMGDLMNYKKQINEEMNSLIDEGKEANADKIDELKNVVENLEISYDEMMNWMHGFSGDFEGMAKKEIMEYLNDQKEKIDQVGMVTIKALKDAEELLAE